MDVMSPMQVSEVLTILKKEKFENVVFGGGEPFLWQGGLIAATKEAKQKGFTVQVGTNGVDLPEGFASIDSIDRYVLPLESVSDQVHNRMRFYKGKHHQIIMGRLSDLKKAGKKVTLSTVITKFNLKELPELASFFEMLNYPDGFIHAWHLYKFIPMGRGGSTHALDLFVTDEEYERTTNQIKSLKLSFDVYKRKNMYCSKTVDFFWFQKGNLCRSSSFFNISC